MKEENGVVNKVLDDNDDDIDVNRKDIEIVNNRQSALRVLCLQNNLEWKG